MNVSPHITDDDLEELRRKLDAIDQQKQKGEDCSEGMSALQDCILKTAERIQKENESL